MDDAPNAMNDADRPFPDGGTLWDARDVARYLKTSRSWIRQNAEVCLLPSLRIGEVSERAPSEFLRLAASGRPRLSLRQDGSVRANHLRCRANHL